MAALAEFGRLASLRPAGRFDQIEPLALDDTSYAHDKTLAQRLFFRVHTVIPVEAHSFKKNVVLVAPGGQRCR